MNRMGIGKCRFFSDRMLLHAHAKLNLWLRVGGRRADGYHAVHTCMGLLDLADWVEIRGGQKGGLRFACLSRQREVGPGDRNLAYRAAEGYMKEYLRRRGMCGWEEVDRWGMMIVLVKRIPVQAGLGGGSSDAGAVLRGLQELMPDGLEAGVVRGIAAGLGSDVPFFLDGRNAVCWGRGEEVKAVELPWVGHVLLVRPPFGVPTGWAYGRLAAMRAEGGWKEEGEEVWGFGGGGRMGLEEMAQRWLWRNDLEEAVFGKFVVLRELKEWLLRRQGVEAVIMAGSGSTIAAVAQEREDLERVVPELERKYGPLCGPAVGGEQEWYREGRFWVYLGRLLKTMKEG